MFGISFTSDDYEYNQLYDEMGYAIDREQIQVINYCPQCQKIQYCFYWDTYPNVMYCCSCGKKIFR